jgi:hypothetical protein
MANDVFANGREISCKKADGKSICAFPDVCFTPPECPATPPGVPIPYPNTAFAKDTSKGSKKVVISGKEIMLKNKSFFKRSTGDEAGCAAKKGIITSKIQGKVYFTTWSMDVKVEGKNVVRHLDLTTHNHDFFPGNSPTWPYFDTMTFDQNSKHRECMGNEVTQISGLSDIASYTGDFPSPLQIMHYTPETNEIFKMHIPDSEIRSWIKDAAEYHGIPHVMLAVILQQENGPNATLYQKAGQFSERTLTTLMAVTDELLFDIVPDKIPSWSPVKAGRNLADGSSGFANMSRPTLRSAAEYTEKYYGKNPLPNDVRYRLLGWDQDTRIPGDDWKADLYYCAAHIRELIDRTTKKRCHNSSLTLDEVESIFTAYNGSGSAARKYGADAMDKLIKAQSGDTILYFYEK